MIDDSFTFSNNTHKRKMDKMRPIIRYQNRTECNVYKWGHCNSMYSVLICKYLFWQLHLFLTLAWIQCIFNTHYLNSSDKEQVMKIVCTRLHVFCKNVIETHGENADYHFLFVIRQVFHYFFHLWDVNVDLHSS